jgi:hypothetical protein
MQEEDILALLEKQIKLFLYLGLDTTKQKQRHTIQGGAVDFPPRRTPRVLNLHLVHSSSHARDQDEDLIYIWAWQLHISCLCSLTGSLPSSDML